MIDAARPSRPAYEEMRSQSMVDLDVEQVWEFPKGDNGVRAANDSRILSAGMNLRRCVVRPVRGGASYNPRCRTDA